MDISRHAQIRTQQRGIPESIVELIVDYGEPKDIIGKAMAYEVSGRTINSLQTHVKHLLNRIERLKNKIVVVSDDGTVITTYHKTDNSGIGNKK
ncbi:MAG: hypothetical protein WD509_01940 [Candidatus Paceibacterota bacterium]